MKFSEFWIVMETDLYPRLRKAGRKGLGWIAHFKRQHEILLSTHASSGMADNVRAFSYSHAWGSIGVSLGIIQTYLGISTRALYDVARHRWNNGMGIEDEEKNLDIPRKSDKMKP